MLHLDKATLMDRMRGALLSFKITHDRLMRARACAKTLSASDADAFWAGPGRCIKQHADAAAWWATTVYKASVAAGLAGCVCSGDRALVIAANRYLDQETLAPSGIPEVAPLSAAVSPDETIIPSYGSGRRLP